MSASDEPRFCVNCRGAHDVKECPSLVWPGGDYGRDSFGEGDCRSTLPPELLATLRLAWQERKQDYAPVLVEVLAEVALVDAGGPHGAKVNPTEYDLWIYRAAFAIREARRLRTEGA